MSGSKSETLCFTTPEVWVPVCGYYGLYEVSNMGRVRSLDRFEIAAGHRRKRSGRVLKQDLTRNGYMAVQLSKDGVVKKKLVHRLVCEGHVCKIKEGFQVNHKDSNRANNVHTNLESVTALENMAHAKCSGSMSPFVTSGIRKRLSDSDVYEIRFKRNDGWKLLDLAELFGVSKQTIWNITKNRTWKVAD